MREHDTCGAILAFRVALKAFGSGVDLASKYNLLLVVLQEHQFRI